MSDPKINLDSQYAKLLEKYETTENAVSSKAIPQKNPRDQLKGHHSQLRMPMEISAKKDSSLALSKAGLNIASHKSLRNLSVPTST
mmetsp:Transcript_744/g.1050  ORF Transcript_744/g.1050 Transcript_744/m.1050 type:complete len:86 (+) Transcript_744:308-565(+)